MHNLQILKFVALQKISSKRLHFHPQFLDKNKYTQRILRVSTIILLCVFFLFGSYASTYAAFLASPISSSPRNQRDNFQTETFTGSASYSYPISVPKGTDDLTPKVNLSYSSAGVRDVSQQVGAGWQLDRDYVQRDANYTPTNTSDDKYKLHFQGQTYDLVYNASDSLFHTKIESHLKIQQFLSGAANFSGVYWQVTTPDGTVYRFGYPNNAETWCSVQTYDTLWNVDQVTDIHNNKMYYTYSQDSGATYLTQIKYNNDQTREVNFMYSASTYPRKAYQQGCSITENNRLTSIQVKTNNSLVHQYDLSYTASTNGQSLLASITEKGNDGTTALPPTTFTYNPQVKSWQRNGSWAINNGMDAFLTMPSAVVRVLDVTGDGYPDIVKVTYNSGFDTYTVYRNNGNTWPNTPEVWVNNFNMDARPDLYSTRLIDVNGDGLPDIVKGSNGSWFVYKNTGSSWNTTAEVWGVNSLVPNFTQTNNEVQLFDANGDGLPDVVKTVNIGGPIDSMLVYKNTGSSFNTSPETWVNQQNMDYMFDQPNVSYMDVNGDGLTDLVKSINNGGPNNDWRVYFNTGNTWELPVTWVNPIDANINISQVLGTDSTGDGLPDIVKVINNGGPSNDWEVWQNKGNSWNATSDSWANPIDTNLDSSETTMADLNGDGLLDVVRAVNSGGFNNDWRFWQNQGNAPDLLSAIHTAKGGTISYEYTPSTHYQNTSLPFPLWVVSKMTVNNGINTNQGTNDVTTYSYKNGFYKWQDKEFRGFGEVNVVEPNGSKIQTLFSQDDATKGLVTQTQTTDTSGNPYAKTENTWNSSQTNGIYTVNLSKVVNTTYDGSVSNPKVTETDYQYDTYGNITKQSELGDVSVSGDERFTYNEYVYNTTAWILNTVKHMYKNAADDFTKMQETWLYYDGSANNNNTPTKGDLTMQTKWLSGGASNPTTTYGYNSFGNQTTIVDANSHTTSTAYDTTGTYPTSTTNAKNQTQSMSYDLGTGNVLSKTDLNGNTTSYSYDVFGRVTKEVRPYDSTNYPTVSYQYFFDGTAPESVLVSKREVSGAAGTLDSTVYVDGLGRKIQTRSDAEDTSQQIVSDIFYDASGEVLRESVAHSDTLSASYAAPVANEKVTEYTYDPLKRITMIRNPKGDVKTTAYDHWKATSVDENGHIKRQFQNAFGKIVKVEEVNGANTYTTTYEYDSRDLLTKILDHNGNMTTMAYDTLGNKITQTDPDSGTWHYEYDGVGNVTKITDNRGIATTNTYDVLDRLTKKDYPTDTDTTFSYDIGKLGTLSIATDSAGTVTYAYDNRLRKIQEQRSVNGTSKTTQYSYDGADRMTTQINPDGEVVTYAFNPQGEINSVTGTSGILSNIDYNAEGKITKKDFANGLSTNYTYNSATDLRLSRIQTGALQDLNYTYDNVGNVKSITDNVTSKMQSFGYDDLDRLTAAFESAGFNYQYQYNPIGNLTKFTSSSTATDFSYGQNAGPHAVTMASASATQATSSATEILGTTWNLAGSNGSAEQNKAIASNTLAGATSIQVTFNLHGTSFGGADDEASVVFVQNADWRAANLIANGAQNGLNGSQTVTIPVSSFHKVGDSSVVLDPNQAVTDLHARFWNSGTFSIDITSVKVVSTTGGGNGPVNLALGKTVTTSSVENNDPTLVGSKAVDGDSSTTRWASAFSDPQWMYIDLGSPTAINHVKLNWETAYGSAYQIQVSNDATNWTTIYSTTTGNGGVDDLTNLSGTGRYVRMYGTSRATIWGYSLYEFEIYGSSTTTDPQTVSAANLTTGTDTDGNSTATTASVSPAANKLELLTVSSKTNITANPNQPTVTGNGLTWVPVASTIYDPVSASRRRVTLFRATGTSTTTGAVSISFGGQNQTDVSWVLDEASNVDTSGTSVRASYPESNATSDSDAAQNAANPGAGQVFTPSQNTVLDSAQFYLSKVGNPTGNGVIKVYAVSGTPGSTAIPTGSALATSDNLNVATLTGSKAMTSLHFSGANRINLTSGTWYAISFEYTAGNTSNYVSIGADDTAPTHAGNEFYYNGTAWVGDSTWDEIFSVSGETAGIVQAAATNAQAATGLTVTLSAFGSASNATYGSFGNDNGDGGGAKPFTAGSGFTLATQSATAGVRAGTEFKATNDTTVDVSQGTDDVGGIAIELKAGTTTVANNPSGNANYTYDANGNMLSDGLHCYHYNEANKLDKVTNCNTSQTTAEYAYDYNGDRMVKKVYTNGTLANTVTSWSDSYETNVIVGGATENTTYYFANGQLLAKKNPDGSKYYIHSDHLGSTSVVTNQAGGLVEATSYDPWGDVKSGGTKSKFLYTGQEHDDESGLHYYNARYYDPHIRRFTQPDDVIDDLYNPQSLNRYSYVKNNPLRFTDPTGHLTGLIGMIADVGEFLLRSVASRIVTTIVTAVATKVSPQNTQQAARVANNVINKTMPSASSQAMQPIKTVSSIANNPSVQKLVSNSGNAINTGLRGMQNPITKASAAYGRMMHSAQTYGEGYIKEFAEVEGIRLDAANPEAQKFIELKPNTITGIEKGLKQINDYEGIIKNQTGQAWRGELQTYEAPTANQLEEFMK